MRNAPSVEYPVGRCAFYAWALLVLGGLGLTVQWAGGSAEPGMVVTTGYVIWLVWVLFALWNWRAWPSGAIRWDACSPDTPGSPGAWIWFSEAYRDGVKLQRVERILDLQSRCLLRLRNPDGASWWVWAERQARVAEWHDFRCALIAHGV